MLAVPVQNLSLSDIAVSGQCFRWKPEKDGYQIIAFGKTLHAAQSSDESMLYLDCSEIEYRQYWESYFDLATDYEAIIRAIPEDDAYLRAAADCGQGIRILRQDSWETLVSFLLSQRKSIPAIRQSVEKLCAAAGQIIAENTEGPIYAFPSPAEIMKISDETLRTCGLGYRAPYIRRAAMACAAQDRLPERLQTLSDNALFDTLCGFYGVGRKIALCTMLFGFHRLNAFPVDVWMNRIAQRHYPGGFPLERYAPWAGVMQQYMFAYERVMDGKIETALRVTAANASY